MTSRSKLKFSKISQSLVALVLFHEHIGNDLLDSLSVSLLWFSFSLSFHRDVILSFVSHPCFSVSVGRGLKIVIIVSSLAYFAHCTDKILFK